MVSFQQPKPAYEKNNTSVNNIRVVVRVRPDNEVEQNSHLRTVVRLLDENLLVFDPKEESSPGFYHGKRKRGRDMLKRRNKDIRFAFDHVFDSNSTNWDVYKNATNGIVNGLIDGYNCSGIRLMFLLFVYFVIIVKTITVIMDGS